MIDAPPEVWAEIEGELEVEFAEWRAAVVEGMNERHGEEGESE